MRRMASLAIAPGGKRLYAAYIDSNSQAALAIIDTSNNEVTQNIALSPYISAPPSVALSPDGTLAYVTHAVGLAIVDTVHGQLLETVAFEVDLTSLAISPDGKVAYTVSGPGVGIYNNAAAVVIFDLTTYQIVKEIPFADVVGFSVAFTPDGAKAYLTGETGPVLIIDTASEKIEGTLPINNSLGITIAAH